MGNNPVTGFDPDGGWDIITAGIKWLGAAIRGENPSAITERFDGEHGFYTSKRYDTGDGSIGVIGATNFDDNGTGYHVALNTINNAWRQSELYPFQDYNPLIGDWRWKQQRASGAIESLYIEEYFINPPSTVAKTGWTALSIAMKAGAKGGRFLVQANRTAGNLFRDDLASVLRAEGRTVNTEVFKWTPFGKRYMDLHVWHNGVNLGGIETKVGSSRYHSLQKLKDAWLGANGYPVQLVRKPQNW